MVFDEILGGTNSAERHAGTEAIIRSRLGSPGVMLVATHDLALAQLAEDFPEQVELAHFADNADEHSTDLEFDYLLRPGVIQSTNALRIMRKAGTFASGDSRPPTPPGRLRRPLGVGAKLAGSIEVDFARQNLGAWP